MSKKDYQALAGAVYSTRQRVPAFSQHFDGQVVSAADILVEELVTLLAADNPRFSRERFVEACETGKTRGMRQVA